jgi:hypothetical protein
VSPLHQAILVDRSDRSAAVSAVQALCESWGGGCGLLLPHDPQTSEISPVWQTLLDSAEVDALTTHELIDNPSPDGEPQAAYTVSAGGGLGFFLPVLIAALEERREDWGTVQVVAPAEADPWFVSYLSALGSWRRELPPNELSIAGLREDVSWNDLVPVDYIDIPAGDGLDLLQRLRTPTESWPTRVSLVRLSVRPAPRHSSIASDTRVLPEASTDLALLGPNIVVVYEPGSVDDLCLTWNLRAAHGLPSGFPLAVPVTADVPRALHQWTSQFAQASFGLGGDRRFCLTSSSVAPDALDDLARSQQRFGEPPPLKRSYSRRLAPDGCRPTLSFFTTASAVSPHCQLMIAAYWIALEGRRPKRGRSSLSTTTRCPQAALSAAIGS